MDIFHACKKDPIFCHLPRHPTSLITHSILVSVSPRKYAEKWETNSMGLGSANMFSAPPIYKQQWQQQPAIYSTQLGSFSNSVSFIVQRTSDLNRQRFLPYFGVLAINKFKACCSQVEVEEGISDEACELVNGTELTIGEGPNVIRAYLFKAVKNNNATGILLLSDIYGFEDSSTRDFAYRVACNGYNVLVPDLFRGNPWREDRPKAYFKQWISVINQHVLEDISASAKWLMNEFVDVGISKKLGIVGFCFGGGQVINLLAQDKGEWFGAGVAFYATRINSSAAGHIKVPLLLISGDNDPLCPVNIYEDIVKRLEGCKLVVFKGRSHAFAHRPQSPEDDGDAEEAFMLMRNWLYNGLLIHK